MRLPGLWPTPRLREVLALVTLPEASERVSTESMPADRARAAERTSSAAACGECAAAATGAAACRRVRMDEVPTAKVCFVQQVPHSSSKRCKAC